MGPTTLGLVDVFNGEPLDETTIAMLGGTLASTKCTREDLTLWLTSMYKPHSGNPNMDLLTGLL